MKTILLASSVRKHRLARPALALVLLAACSPSMDDSRRPRDEPVGPRLAGPKLVFPSQEMAAKHKAAKAAPDSVDAVLDYARSLALFCLASLLDTRCSSCDGDLPAYRPRSDLNTAYWPAIDDALPMLDPFLESRTLDAGQMDVLVEVKGRLLWLAGRSSEEQALIDSYVLAHPTAIAIVKRRLEILRDASDSYLFNSQCTRSRARMQSAPEAARLDLLTSCVRLHPNNAEVKSDTAEYATYLPNLSAAETALYRSYLIERCTEEIGDEGSRCAEACGCEGKDAGKSPTTKCKRACGSCRKETAQALLACKKVGEVVPEHAPAQQPAEGS